MVDVMQSSAIRGATQAAAKNLQTLNGLVKLKVQQSENDMHRVPEVEITRSLADPALRIKAFLDCAEMLLPAHLTYEKGTQCITGRSTSRATMVFAQISPTGDSVTWKFKFGSREAAEAFNDKFDV